MPDALVLFAQATLEISAPLDLVRAEFFDVEHHVRDAIYQGHELSWAPEHPPEACRLHMITRILGRMQEEDVVIGSEGEHWVRHYVTGVNAGAKLLARFAFVDGKTRVRLEAHVGPKGFVSGLGKLSKNGMEKALEKMLAEHQRAIEGYRPSASNKSLRAVMASLRALSTRLAELDEQQRYTALQTILELSSLVAIADGEADVAERDALRLILKELCNVELSREGLDQMIQSAFAIVEAEGMEARCAALGKQLDAFKLAALGIEVAALVAMVSHGLDLHEMAALTAVAEATNLPPDAIDDILATLDRELQGQAGA